MKLSSGVPRPAFGAETFTYAAAILPTFVVPGLLAASLAALFSALARRPRRGVITFGAVFLSLVAAFLAVASAAHLFRAPEPLFYALGAWAALLICALGATLLTTGIARKRYGQ